jgi:DDE superfamily endonuclease
MCISDKGWTDNELAIAWLKDFDRQTKEKAGGHARLLLVDGHNSHYSYEFINYAIASNIIVMCYPAHTTHVVQGLDVVAFSVLKQNWTVERDKWNVSHHPEKISKTTFLCVYAAAHQNSFTTKNILASFAKTGVWPFNASVVTPKQMAPSTAHLTTGSLPIEVTSPVKCIMYFHNQLMAKQYN